MTGGVRLGEALVGGNGVSPGSLFIKPQYGALITFLLITRILFIKTVG